MKMGSKIKKLLNVREKLCLSSSPKKTMTPNQPPRLREKFSSLIGLTQNCPGKAQSRRQYKRTARRSNAAGAVLRKSYLKWEITLALLIKLALLFLIWNLFFSVPQAKHMHMSEPQVTQHLLTSNTPYPSSNQQSQPTGVTNDR